LRAQRRNRTGFPLNRPRHAEACGRHPGRRDGLDRARRAVKPHLAALL